MESIEARKAALVAWLKTECGLSFSSATPLPGHASLRRYYRVVTPTTTFIAMDAPPPENCQPYVAVASTLRRVGLKAPEVFAEDIKSGFLLLSDFGEVTYLKGLNASNADQLYLLALQALSVLQGVTNVPGRETPPFTRDFMQKEWAWHKEWFMQKLLGMQLGADQMAKLDSCYTAIIESAANEPQVFMHRDYHSGNLMVTPQGDVAILDFQDAFIGPVTYDLVSLLRDCYIDWPEEQVTKWVLSYWQMLSDLGVLPGVDKQTFLRWFDWMGVQRHLKAILTFARKHVRDQQPEYLAHIPRTLTYLKNATAKYPELAAMYEYVILTQDKFERVKLTCAQ